MHQHFQEPPGLAELIKVGGVGLLGFLTSMRLADWNLLASFMVALASLGYIVTRWVFMIIDRREKKRKKHYSRYNLD